VSSSCELRIREHSLTIVRFYLRLLTMHALVLALVGVFLAVRCERGRTSLYHKYQKRMHAKRQCVSGTHMAVSETACGNNLSTRDRAANLTFKLNNFHGPWHVRRVCLVCNHWHRQLRYTVT